MNSKRKKILILISVFLLFIALAVGVQACGQKSGNTPSTFIISFNAQGGSPVQSVTLDGGVPLAQAFPESAPTRSGFVFLGWFYDSACERAVNIYTAKAVKSLTLFAGWESVDTYPHAITVMPTPNGTVTADRERASKGTTVKLEVRPYVGFILEEGSLLVNGSPVNTVTLSFVMPAEAVSVTATFVPYPYDVKVSSTTVNGSIRLSATKASEGTIIGVSAIPDVGYYLESLSYNNTAIDLKYGLFAMPGTDVTVYAMFQPIDYYDLHIVTVVNPANGSITVDKVRASRGEYVLVSAIANEGYRIFSLKCGDDDIGDEGFIMPNGDVTITADVRPINEFLEMPLTVVNCPHVSTVILNEKANYSQGEKIDIEITPQVGYSLESVLLNSRFLTITEPLSGGTYRLSATMPAEAATLTVNCAPKGYSITASIDGNNNGTLNISHSYAYAGELITVSAVPNEAAFIIGEVLCNGTAISNGYFIMPAENVVIAVQFVTTNQIKTIETASFENGSVSVLSAAPHYAYNTITLAVNPNPNYRLVADSLTYTFPGYPDREPVKITGNSFKMPTYNIRIHAEFERVYKLTAYESEAVNVYPDKEWAAEGEAVWLTVSARGKTIPGSITVTYNGANELLTGTDNSIYFEMIEADVVLGVKGEFRTVGNNNAKITYVKSSGGELSGVNTGYYGEKIRLAVTPNDGYKLSALYYTYDNAAEPKTKYNISDTFIMPEARITVTAEFTEAAAEAFSLEKVYSNYKESFSAKGIFLYYLRTRDQLRKKYQSAPGVLTFVNYIEGVIEAKSSVGHSFYIAAVTDVLKASIIGQKLLAHYSETEQNIDCHIYSNYIVLSVGGEAGEDFALLRGGLTYDEGSGNRFLVYPRADGTYGIYAYISKGEPFVTIPETATTVASQKRIISYIAPFAFQRGGNLVKGLNPGNVKVFPRFALTGLTSIETLDISRAEKILPGAFVGANSLKQFILAASSTNFNLNDGALYRGRTLIAYPAARAVQSVVIYALTDTIADYAFYGASNLVNVQFNRNNLKKIGSHAFYGCSALRKVYPSGTTSPADFTVNLESSAVNSIGSLAFSGNVLIYNFNLGSVAVLEAEAIEVSSLDQDTAVNLNYSAVVKARGTPIKISTSKIVTIYVPYSLIQAYQSDLYWGSGYLISYMPV